MAMHTQPLTLNDQTLLEDKLRKLNLTLSEYSFANLYLFRQIHRYEVIQENNEVFIRGKTRDNVSFIMLTSPPSQITFSNLINILKTVQIIYPVPEEWLPFFSRWTNEKTFNEADSDYIYDTKTFVRYPGRHLDGKRNLVRHFLDSYDIRLEKFSEQIDDAILILNTWQSEQAEKSIDQTDFAACSEAIQNVKKLKLEGLIIYADNSPAGFIIGEKIDGNGFAVHFSKASHSYKGIFQYLFQELAKSIEGICPWINLEQDLGLVALRESKRSYHPVRLEKKWRLKIYT